MDCLNREPDELNALYKDLLIGVTQFFRDREAFELLDQAVVGPLIDQASDDGLRIWVAACATGEESYSLAMLLREAARRKKANIDIKVFATDVHQRSLDRAGAGVFSEASVADIGPNWLSRYFTKQGDDYRVVDELRRMVIFAPHNVINDPPFTRMDLVTCRNMLIYLKPVVQQGAISLLHFALKTGVVLWLGPSETVGDVADEFDTVDSHWKMFRKRRDVRLPTATRLRSSLGSSRIRQRFRG